MSVLMAEQTIAGAVRDYGKRLFRFIRGRVSSDADAEDLLQEVWYQFSRVLSVEPIEQVGAWLFRVARNKVTDRYRRTSTDSLDALVYEDEDGVLDFRDILLAEPTTPESEYLRELFWQELFAALDELPEAQRNVFVWNELEDETFQQIADRTGENIKTLISRKRYAVQHLRERLGTFYREFLS